MKNIRIYIYKNLMQSDEKTHLLIIFTVNENQFTGIRCQVYC